MWQREAVKDRLKRRSAFFSFSSPHNSCIGHSGLLCYTPRSASINKPAHFNEHAVLIYDVYVYSSRRPVRSSAPGYTSTGSPLICLTFWSQWTERVRRSRYRTWLSAASNKNWEDARPPENTINAQQLQCMSCTVIELIQNHWSSFQVAMMFFRKHEESDVFVTKGVWLTLYKRAQQL